MDVVCVCVDNWPSRLLWKDGNGYVAFIFFFLLSSALFIFFFNNIVSLSL